MKKRSQFKIVCFLITIMLIMSCCFVGCGANKTSSSQIETTITTTVAPTTQQSTTVAPTTVPSTTVKPTEAPKPTEKVESSNVEEEENDYNYDYEDYNTDTNTNDNNVPDSMSGGAIYSPSEFMNAGVINWGGWTWTYYSERILPGDGLWIPGRWTDSDGYVCDENGYVCLASTSVARYSIIETPFGRTGKVYDSGCDYGVMDIYVNW